MLFDIGEDICVRLVHKITHLGVIVVIHHDNMQAHGMMMIQPGNRAAPIYNITRRDNKRGNKGWWCHYQSYREEKINSIMIKNSKCI